MRLKDTEAKAGRHGEIAAVFITRVYIGHPLRRGVNEVRVASVHRTCHKREIRLLLRLAAPVAQVDRAAAF